VSQSISRRVSLAHKFDPKNAEILESRDRKNFLDPDYILGKIGLDRETVLADLGCGTGFFSIPASMLVKKVYALDVQQDMLDILDDKIQKKRLTNINTLLSEESSIPLPDNSVDVLFMANVFHELEDRSSLLKEAYRILSTRGRLVIIDWNKMEMDFGPPLDERLTPHEVISFCKKEGFKMLERSEAGNYNYLLIFEKAL